jgi:hypothetical protein
MKRFKGTVEVPRVLLAAALNIGDWTKMHIEAVERIREIAKIEVEDIPDNLDSQN